MNTEPKQPTFPPPERAQHGEIEHVHDALSGRQFYRDPEPSQIEKYFGRGLLGKDRVEAAELRDAGMEYGRLAYVGCLGPRYAKLNMHRIAAIPSDGLAQQEAAEKIREADKALGSTHASFVWAVCVEDWTADAWAKERARQHGWGPPGRGFGIALLIDALRILSAHWASG